MSEMMRWLILRRLKSKSPETRRQAAKDLGSFRGADVLHALVRAMTGDQDENVRQAAAAALGGIGDVHSVDSLAFVLKEDQGVNVRKTAAEALEKIGDSRAAKPLLAALDDWSRDVRLAAASALSTVGTDKSAGYRSLLKDEDERVRLRAVHGLLRVGDVDALVGALRVRDGDVRRAAYKGLCSMQWRPVSDEQRILDALARHDWEELVRFGASAVDVLDVALLEKDSWVRLEAIKALGRIRDPRAVGPLVKAVRYTSRTEKEVLDALREALAELGAAAADALVAAIDDALQPDVQLAESDSQAMNLASTLVEVDAPRAVPALLHLRKRGAWGAFEKLCDLGPRGAGALAAALDDESVREQAVEVLAMLGTSANDHLLAAILGSRDVRKQATLAILLGKTKDIRAVEPLLAALDCQDLEIRKQAASLLGGLRDSRAVDRLIQALKDTGPDVAKNAAYALGEIGDTRGIGALVAILEADACRDELFPAVAWALCKTKDAGAVDAVASKIPDFRALRALIDSHCGWQPANPFQSAWLCLYMQSFQHLPSLGAAAVGPLLAYVVGDAPGIVDAMPRAWVEAGMHCLASVMERAIQDVSTENLQRINKLGAVVCSVREISGLAELGAVTYTLPMSKLAGYSKVIQIAGTELTRRGVSA